MLAVGLAVALASSVLPYPLELEALRRLPAAVFGVLMSLEPAVAALAGWVVLDQVLGARELLAIALVVVASAGAAALSGAEDAPAPASSATRSPGASSISSPRRPALTNTVWCRVALSSTSVGSARRWPSGEIPPAT